MKDFKIYLQHDAMQCGIACLCMICSHYGADYSFDRLSKLYFTTSESVSLAIRVTHIWILMAMHLDATLLPARLRMPLDTLEYSVGEKT